MTERKIKGNVTELKVMEAFIERGYTVSIPYGDSAKYDLLVDLGNRIIKIQSKFVELKEENGGIIKIRGYSCRRGYKSVYSSEDIDYLATSYQENCYLIPISFMAERNTIKLRFSNPKNNQVKNIHFAKDFLIDKVLAGLAQW